MVFEFHHRPRATVGAVGTASKTAACTPARLTRRASQAECLRTPSTVRLWGMSVDQAIQRICSTTTPLTSKQWPVYVSLLGFNLQNMSGGKRLLAATAAFRNEPYN